MRILVVEDDPIIANNISRFLTRYNFLVDLAGSVTEATNKIAIEDYDLLILDWMLPDEEGTVLCQKLRQEKNIIPILMITAKSQLADKVQGLETGADDYLTKPFELEELLARVRALLRRNAEVFVPNILKVRDLELDVNACQLKKSNKVIELSPKEYSILEYLWRNIGKVVTRQELFSHAWDEHGEFWNNSLEVHIRYIRQKIGDDNKKNPIIKTVKGQGYMLCAD